MNGPSEQWLLEMAEREDGESVSVGGLAVELGMCKSDCILSFTVLGRPQQRGSKQAGALYGRDGKPVTKNGRVLTFAKDTNHERSRVWMDQVRQAAGDAYGTGKPLLKCPIKLGVRFYFNRPQSHYGSGKNASKLKPSAPSEHCQSPDLAKLIRCLEDALTGVVWVDDKLVYRYTGDTGRYWTEAQERAEVFIYYAE